MHALPIHTMAARSGSLKRQAGIDLIQLSVAVGIIAFILAVGFLVVPTVMTNIKVNSETSDIQQSVSNALRVFGSGADSSGLTTDVAVSLKLSPPDRISGKTILNRFGGTVDWSHGSVFGNEDGLTITSKGYSAEACAKLVPNVQALFARIKIGGTTVKDTANGTALSVSSLGTACNPGGGKTADIEFAFTK
ncbi:hypothetical protein LQR31_12010 [Chromobacterium vaccinii]|uniref:type 4 pilus major pilin n=1 Tax=Chromobacterium vaccinii TaxID=1108595 RepID=UPI001E49E854|nr:type 4 pilus major pilin [Chromobacterium vaccinii]MCD4485202.1 hypothetical protein [Chromobacterium vaccinii]